MKTIGLIGGMSWESTIPYYSVINRRVRERLGGLHSAKLILYSVDFAEVERYQSAGEWDRAAEILKDAAKKLELAGADLLLICTNTLHRVYNQVQSAVKLPIVHIADATADALEMENIRRAALLGTKYTMTQDFYTERLRARGIEPLIPGEQDVERVNDIIFNELCVGSFREESRKRFARVIADMKDRGAEAVILGCTEIGLLVRPEDSALKLFDTTVIHAERAAELALRGGDGS